MYLLHTQAFQMLTNQNNKKKTDELVRNKSTSQRTLYDAVYTQLTQ